MNFPQPGFPPAFGGAPAAAPGFAQPTQFGGAPGHAAPSAPFGGAPAAPPAATPAQTVWVHVNGQTTEIDVNQARALPPQTPAMKGDQSGGWVQLGQLLGPAVAPAPAPAPVPATPAAPALSGAPGGFPPQQQQAFHPQPQSQQPFPGQQPAPGGFYGQAPQGGSAFQQPGNARPPVAAPPGLFSGAANASANRSGANMEEGDYIARYIGAEFKQGTGNNSSKQWVIHEVEIVQSSFVAGDPVRGKCNQPGSRVSIFVTKNVSFDSNMKEIALALMPLDAQGQRRQDNAYVSEQEFATLLQDPCPLAGKYVYLEARKKPTQGRNGQPPGEFTRIQWFHIPTDAAGNPDVARMHSEGWR